MGSRSARATPVPTRPMRQKPADESDVPARSAPAPPAPAAPVHSKPVVIPPRSPARAGIETSTQTVRARGHNGGRPHRAPKSHRTDAIPPAVAALLAVTAIPKMPARRKGALRDRRISMDELIQEWRQDEPEIVPSVVGSPLDLLLGRVDESEDDYGSLVSIEQEKDSMVSHSVTSRSISSDSISTIPPSLDTDAPSFTSNWDTLSTPESYRQRPTLERREKIVSSPPKEDCVLDHPLLHFTPDDCEEIVNLEIPDIVETPSASTERFKSFKSNLTASLQALKSAAKSFSNFTAPSVPPDDLLTRSLLSPKFTSEMRPKLMQGLPSPALRRYLNPQPTGITPSDLSMQLHDALMLDVDEDTLAPMIQMQTYERRHRSSKRRQSKSVDPFSEAGRALSPSPPVRQREPRENSDFLRVIVLEMNMRRVGKLDAKAVGKARIWLPPRKLGSSKPPSIRNSSGGVPERWVTTLADGL
jgi:hypothetical protein